MARSHDTDWREKIPRVVLQIIARDGLEATSIRRIASELGTSTAVITHNFPDKQGLLLWTYRQFSTGANKRYHQIIANDPADVVGYLMSMTAIGEENMAHWRAYVAVWDKSLRDTEFKDELFSWVARGLTRIESCLQHRNPGQTNTRIVAKQLLAMVEGISVQRIFDENSWSEEEVYNAYDAQVRAIMGPPTSG